MMPTAINSPDDPRVRVYRELPSRKSGRDNPHFVVEGRWLVQRLINSKLQTASILCGELQAEEFAALGHAIPVYVASPELLSQIVGFDFHRGILACGRRPPSLSLASAAEIWHAPVAIAACAGVCDQENLGSVIRNCRAFGVGGLIVDSDCADAFSRRVLRVSAGAALDLTIVESGDLCRDLAELKTGHGFRLVATVTDRAAAEIEAAPVHEKLVITFATKASAWIKGCEIFAMTR